MNALHRIAQAWRVLTWKHWAWATGLALVVSVAMPLQTFDANSHWAVQRVMYHTPWFIFFSYVFVAAIGWVESSAVSAAPPMSRYIAAIAAAGVLCVVLAAGLADSILMPQQRIVDGKVVPLQAKVNREWNHRISAALLGFDAAFHGCLATLIYVRLRNSRRTARALAEAEIGRSEANRNLLTSELETAHAQIDPARVIERLEAIGRTYDADPVAADSQLDELIGVLRAAIPRLRSTPMPEPQP